MNELMYKYSHMVRLTHGLNDHDKLKLLFL